MLLALAKGNIFGSKNIGGISDCFLAMQDVYSSNEESSETFGCMAAKMQH